MKKIYFLICLSFFCSLLLSEAVAGESCETATAAEGINTVPATTGNNYWYSFTMPSEGKLSISSEVSKYLEVYTNTCENLNYIGYGNGNAGILGIAAGEQVYIRWDTYNGGNFSWNLAVEAFEEGDMCSLAAAATIDANTVPATTGDYWYSFTMPSEGKLNISSEVGDYVRVYTNTCENLNYKGNGYGNAGVTGIAAGEEVFIRWRTENGGNFSWNLAVEAYVEGDMCSLAAAATIDANTVPATTGEYWYSFTMPSEGKLNISSQVSEYIEVYTNTCENLNYKGYGYGNAGILGIAAGEQVYIKWYTSNGGNFSWNLAVEAYMEGDMCSLAAAATIDANSVPATTGEYWYSFTMPSEGKLSLTTEAYESVEVYTNTCDNLYNVAVGYRNASAAGIPPGEQVYIRWETSNGGNFSWNLAVEPYVEGDMCSLAAAATIDANAVPATTGEHYWYSFTMPSEGKLSLTTEAYESVEVYTNTCDNLNYVDGGWRNAGVTGIAAGEQVYIRWETFNGGNFSWNLAVEPYVEDENCLLAAAAVGGTNTTPSAPFWFSFTVPQDGNLTISSVGTATNDTYLKVYGSCFENDLIDFNDDFSSLQSELSFSNLQAGEVLYIKWDDNYSMDGFDWNLTFEPAVKSSQTINFAAIEDQLFSTGSIQLEATASSGLDVNYEITAGSTTFSGSTLSFTSAGPVTVTAYQDGNTEFAAAEPVSQTFCINPDKPVISIADGAAAEIGATLVSSSSTENQWYKDDVLLEGATSETYTTTQTGVYSLQVTAGECTSLISDGIQISQASQSISFAAITSRPLSEGSMVLEATASSGLAVTYVVTSGPATLSGNTLTFTAVGEVTVTASQNGNTDYAAAEPVSQTFCVSPNKPVISIEGGAAPTEGATLVSSSSTGNQWYRDGAVIAGAVDQNFTTQLNGLYTVKVSQGGCTSLSSDGIQIGKINQHISFGGISAKSLSDGTLSLSATASSGLTVVYAVTSGPATVSGSTLTFTGAGSVTVTASQNGNADYTVAEPVSQTFCVNPDKPVVSVRNGGAAEVGATLVSSSSTGNQWYKNGAIIAAATGSTFLTTETGTYTVKVTVDGCSSPLSTGLVVSKKSQTITFAPIEDQALSTGSIQLGATASSGLALSYEVTAGSATMSGAELVFDGAGSVTVTASQEGDAAYEAAEPVSQTFCVNPAKPAISIQDGGAAEVGATLVSSSSTGNQWYKDGVLLIGATGGSYTTTETGLYTVQVTAGECMSPLSDGVAIEPVVKSTQTITFAPIADQSLSAGSIQLEATASSGLALSYEVTAGSATISGTELTFNGAGSVTVTASQEGDAAYEAAAPVSQAFCVNPDKPIITIENEEEPVVGATLVSSSASGNQWYRDGTEVAGAVSQTYETSMTGLYTLVVSKGGCTSVSSNATQIGKMSQQIDFASISTKAVSDESLLLEATASSGLPVLFEVTSGAATVSSNILTFSAAGEVTVTAKQEGDAAYEAAAPVSQTFCVNPAKPAITVQDGAEPVVGATLVSSSSTGNQWYKDGALLEGATMETFTSTETGFYTVQVAAGVCQSPISEGIEISEVTGIASGFGNEPLKLFPNPTLDLVNIVFESTKKIADISVYVLDVRGREVKLTPSVKEQAGKKIVQVDLSAVAPGVYGVFIKDGDKLTTAKILKK